MSYNLLFNTQFKDTTRWNFTNCYLEDGYLISTDKTFGISQELVLPNITKLYFRCKYKTINKEITKAYIGINNSNKLSVTTEIPKQNKEKIISVVEEATQEKVQVYIIFESTEKENKIKISEPLLYDLKANSKSFCIKPLLDKLIKYRFGFGYNNLLEYSELTEEIVESKKAKVGIIISTLDKVVIPINAKLYDKYSYIIKLDYKEINNLGKVYIKYGIMQSIKIDEEQLYLSFKGNKNCKLELIIEPNDILPYQINLKHLLLIDASMQNIAKQDIPYLPFI